MSKEIKVILVSKEVCKLISAQETLEKQQLQEQDCTAKQLIVKFRGLFTVSQTETYVFEV